MCHLQVKPVKKRYEGSVLIRLLKILLALLLLISFAWLYIYDGFEYFTFSYIKTQQYVFQDYYQLNPFKTMAIFFTVFVFATAISLPWASLLSLLAGALFGFVWGTALVSVASLIGATMAFLMSRWLLRDWVQRKFADVLEPVNKGLEEQGAFYLFSLRIAPLIPFFLVNLVMGLTPIRLRTYVWVSFFGMLIWIMIYVNAGARLSQLQSLEGILSLEIMLALAVLALFPFVTKKILDEIQKQRAG